MSRTISVVLPAPLKPAKPIARMTQGSLPSALATVYLVVRPGKCERQSVRRDAGGDFTA
jgi:hypothetical protein